MRVPACLAAFTLLILPGALNAAPPPAPVHTPAPLAAHRAMYELTFMPLTGPRQGNAKQINGGHGTMGYEVADVCDGWATRQRLRMTLQNAEGPDVEMESDYVTWESKDGLSFRFHSVQQVDGSVNTQTDGAAHLTRTGGTGEVRYRIPKDKKADLPAGTMFPMAHTQVIITAAREGRKFLALPLFDGTDDNGFEDSSVVIMDWKQPFETKFKSLDTQPSTRMRLAFFDHAGRSQTPGFEEAMRYWENGVADDLTMDFGDFVMHGTMTEMTPLPRKC